MEGKNNLKIADSCPLKADNGGELYLKKQKRNFSCKKTGKERVPFGIFIDLEGARDYNTQVNRGSVSPRSCFDLGGNYGIV